MTGSHAPTASPSLARTDGAVPQQVAILTRRGAEAARGRRSSDCSADCGLTPDPAAACISVDLLGGLRVRTGRTSLGPRDLGGNKIRRLLLTLLLHRGSPLSRDRLISHLWDGAPPRGANASLEGYVCLLRKTLQPCKETGASLITTQAGCYAIDMRRVDLDLVRYERQMLAALRPETTATEALEMLQQPVTMAKSPLLPEETGCDWLDEMRNIHNQKVRKNLIAASRKVAGHQSDHATQWANLALEGDLLDESAWYALLQSMEARGQHADGLRAYNRCRVLLASELGCSPGPGLQEMYLRLLRGANEHSTELSPLFDAVVRLHAVSQLSAQPAVRALRSQQPDWSEHADLVEQAFRAMDLLLRSVGGDCQPGETLDRVTEPGETLDRVTITEGSATAG